MPHGMSQSSGRQRYSCSCGLTQHSSRLSGKCKQCHSSLKPTKALAEANDPLPAQPTVDPATAPRAVRPTGSQPAVRALRTEASPSTVDERAPTAERRRSRSADRSDGQRNINEPPPYYTLVDSSRRRNGLHRTGSEEPTYRTQTRRTRATPPPSYMDAESSNPPSYEEALASSMSRLSTNSGLSALIATTPAFRERSSFSSGLFDTPLARSEAQRYSNRETSRNARRLTQHQAEREAERERDQELEEMERQRLRELQVAQYCGCAKCQSLFYNYYYDEAAVSEAPPFPMETQVIMQQFFGDGLNFCSVM